uniref:Uncharacterized protein n=1 Tax=Arundo donax TaxID=35708 RepID=A0A0A8ZPJ3_ARUDO
MHLFVFFLGW